MEMFGEMEGLSKGLRTVGCKPQVASHWSTVTSVRVLSTVALERAESLSFLHSEL